VNENTAARDALRKRLLQYPGATEESVETDIYRYEERKDEKRSLIEGGYSNAAAEVYLDRKGFPRPPSWHSVFFYPGSARPRAAAMFWACVFGAIIGWLIG
jgi:hypothetical protein